MVTWLVHRNACMCTSPLLRILGIAFNSLYGSNVTLTTLSVYHYVIYFQSLFFLSGTKLLLISIIFCDVQGHYHMPETRGLCLSEEQTISTVRDLKNILLPVRLCG